MISDSGLGFHDLTITVFPIWSTCFCSDVSSIHFAHLCQVLVLQFYSSDLQISLNPAEFCTNYFSEHLIPSHELPSNYFFNFISHISSIVIINFSQNILVIITLANFRLQHTLANSELEHTYPFVHTISMT